MRNRRSAARAHQDRTLSPRSLLRNQARPAGLLVALVGLAAPWARAQQLTATPARPDPTNVLLIIGDDVGVDFALLWRARARRRPRPSTLAHGVLFRNAYSRASLLADARQGIPDQRALQRTGIGLVIQTDLPEYALALDNPRCPNCSTPTNQRHAALFGDRQVASEFAAQRGHVQPQPARFRWWFSGRARQLPQAARSYFAHNRVVNGAILEHDLRDHRTSRQRRWRGSGHARAVVLLPGLQRTAPPVPQAACESAPLHADGRAAGQRAGPCAGRGRGHGHRARPAARVDRSDSARAHDDHLRRRQRHDFGGGAAAVPAQSIQGHALRRRHQRADDRLRPSRRCVRSRLQRVRQHGRFVPDDRRSARHECRGRAVRRSTDRRRQPAPLLRRPDARRCANGCTPTSSSPTDRDPTTRWDG